MIKRKNAGFLVNPAFLIAGGSIVVFGLSQGLIELAVQRGGNDGIYLTRVFFKNKIMVKKFISLIFSSLRFFSKKTCRKFMEFEGVLRLSMESDQSKSDPEDWSSTNYILSLIHI